MDAVNSVGTPCKPWFPERRKTPCTAILIKGEVGKIMGTRWMVLGDLGQVVLSAHRLGGGRNKNVYIDCSDLAKFTFPSNSDPRTYRN